MPGGWSKCRQLLIKFKVSELIAFEQVTHQAHLSVDVFIVGKIDQGDVVIRGLDHLEDLNVDENTLIRAHQCINFAGGFFPF